MRRALIVVASAVAGAVLPLSGAQADSTVVVRGLGFAPGSSTNLAVMGCSGLYDAAPAGVTTYLASSPGGPAGKRALMYDLEGGTAVGSQHHVSSLASTSVAGLAALAPQGTSGVAYAAFQSTEDAGTDLFWVGRAPLTVGAGPWQRLDATTLDYAWTQYALGTRSPTGSDGGQATVADFLAAHGGDAPGFYAVGLGCDGNPFEVDALQTGVAGDVTTYDLEGYTTTTGISGSATRITAGDAVTLDGTLTGDLVGPLAQGLLVLEARPFGQDSFEPVDGAALQVSGGGVSTTVRPSARTLYRWRFGGSSSADGSVSAPFVVDVASVVTAAPGPATAAGDPAITGKTLPARPGARVTLWRLGAGGPRAIGSATSAADGSYSVTVPGDQTGSWRYFVTVPAGGGNLPGQSPTQVFTAAK